MGRSASKIFKSIEGMFDRMIVQFMNTCGEMMVDTKAMTVAEKLRSHWRQFASKTTKASGRYQGTPLFAKG